MQWAGQVGNREGCLSRVNVHGVQEMAGAEDDDAWMTTGADELDAELAAREAEQGAPPGGTGAGGRAAPAFDPEQMAERVKVSSCLAVP